MIEKLLPLEGGCRCGQVRIRIETPPILTMACHCTGCQKMSSSAYSLSATIPSSGFFVIQGEPIIGGLHGASKHYFCPYCKSWLFTRPEGLDELVNLRPTMLENSTWFKPFFENCTSDKLPWVSIPVKYSFDKFPPLDFYEKLVREYAEENKSI